MRPSYACVYKVQQLQRPAGLKLRSLEGRDGPEESDGCWLFFLRLMKRAGSGLCPFENAGWVHGLGVGSDKGKGVACQTRVVA